MKLLKVAAIAAIVFSGSALAGVVPQYGGGGNHGGGGNNSGPNSIDPRDVLKIDNLGVLAAESALLEHLNTVGVDLNVFKPTRTFVLEQQGVVVHTRHPHGVR